MKSSNTCRLDGERDQFHQIDRPQGPTWFPSVLSRLRVTYLQSSCAYLVLYIGIFCYQGLVMIKIIIELIRIFFTSRIARILINDGRILPILLTPLPI